jgi:predicted 2-oxoglutarate/Fe(II)-dependent dioxygenase YbiX
MTQDKTIEFEKNGYTYFPNLLLLKDCEQYVQELKKIVESGITTKDHQCPLSEAIHGHPIFDSLLEQLQPHFENVLNKKLHPTYAYARLYKPNEELKIHTDRPACEISATITLGFDGKQWPIYMGDKDDKSDGNEILMNVGDAVLYRGMEKYHWRNKFEGEWQAQVFLHYVDANGKHANQKYDGRERLAHHPVNKELNLWVLENAFSKEHCEKIIKQCENAVLHKAQIGLQNDNVDLNIRDVNKLILDYHKGVGATLTGIALQANYELWNFNISRSNQCEFLKYDENGHYVSHTDTFMLKNQDEYRKLTALLILNDDFEGGQFYIQDGHKKTYPKQKAGDVIVFPSFILHGVEPVKSGVRRAIVTWLVGDWFK